MDDIAAVPTAVPSDERREGAQPRRAAERVSGAGSADELEHDGREREAQNVYPTLESRTPRRARPGSPQASAKAAGPGERPPQPSQRRTAPDDERPDTHQEEQRQAEGLEEKDCSTAARRSRARRGAPRSGLGTARPRGSSGRRRRAAGCCRARLTRHGRLEPRLGTEQREAGRTSRIDPASTIPMKPRNHGPIELSVKEWIELMIPERVRKVPNSASAKAPITRTTFQIFSIPRFSWIITEWERRRGEPRHQRGVLGGIPRSSRPSPPRRRPSGRRGAGRSRETSTRRASTGR